MDVKKKLAVAALKMFSQSGYAAVSVRDITKAVGRRETSLYNYYSNKQGLLDSLAADFEAGAQAAVKELRIELKQAETVHRADFLRMAEGFLESYLLPPDFVQFARVLLIEQGNSEEMLRMYTNYLYIIPLIYIRELFAKAEHCGALLNKGSVDFLSTSFYGVVLLYFQKHMMQGRSQKSMKAACLHELLPHVREFAGLYIAE